MKSQADALREISEIKQLMERSSRFLSLSGLSGIFAGVYALIAAVIVYFRAYQPDDSIFYRRAYFSENTVKELIFIGIATLVLAISTGLIFSYRKAKKSGEPIWNNSSKRVVFNLAIPLATGGIFSIILLLKGMAIMVAPVTLIFYGLSLVNASKYTFGDIRSLGIGEIILGLLAAYFSGYGLFFWAIGFGILHILYGGIMYYKYER
ncbi:hypothetical protein V6R21_06910 [Limibacter armeniacum]|uniref:hypothetical protein n=1 Tax=Limibacter armeniacum TaxID=466084 RepID=UPI002FE628FF